MAAPCDSPVTADRQEEHEAPRAARRWRGNDNQKWRRQPGLVRRGSCPAMQPAQLSVCRRRPRTSTPTKGRSSSPSPSLALPFGGTPQPDVGVMENRRVFPEARPIVSRPTPVAGLSSTEPLTVEEISEGTLTEDMLRAASGMQQLQTITRLDLVIDSAVTPSVEAVWAAVPSLHTLVLDGSRLLSFRDLGVDLRNLRTLSLERSSIEDLDGISVLSGLRELRLGRNQISDVTALACHGNLQVLNLELNRVGDMTALEILGTLPLLYSLNLRQNSLMVSLASLPGNQGRGVVHSLIRQLRILDGSPLLSYEEAMIDARTVGKANMLIREGASRARAAWSDEHTSSASVSGGGSAKERGEGQGSAGSLVSSSRRGADTGITRWSSDLGIVHWDSDLTQGGWQAISGNPSSAIRRHKMRGDTSKRQTAPSPHSVLDTLDLAKQMELGLRYSYNQVADRVSEWRRETCFDSLSHEENLRPSPHAIGNNISTNGSCPASSTDLSPTYSTLGAIRNDRDGRSTPPLSHNACNELGARSVPSEQGKKPGDGHDGYPGFRLREEGNFSTRARRRTPAGTCTSSSIDIPRAQEPEEEGEEWAGGAPRKSGTAGGLKVLSRPWTTGHVVDGSSSTRMSSELVPSLRRTRASTSNNPTAMDANGSGGKGTMSSGTTINVGTNVAVGLPAWGKERHRIRHQERQRSHTSADSGWYDIDHNGTGAERDDDSIVKTSWQPVWESLQATGLLSLTRTSEPMLTSADQGLSPSTRTAPGRTVIGRSRGNVDFRRQRRARTAGVRPAGRIRRDLSGEHANVESDGASVTGAAAVDEDDGSNASSEDADSRDEIKRRASTFAFSGPAKAVAPDVCGAGAPCHFIRGSAFHGACVETNSSDAGGKAQQRQQHRPQTACRRAASRRSLAAMDDSSSSTSEEEETVDSNKTRTTRGNGGVMSNSGIVGKRAGRGVSGDDGGGSRSPPPRRISSIHAGRMLGFDLNKSLAAIDEWTHKMTSTNEHNRNERTPGGQRAKGEAGVVGEGRPRSPPFLVAKDTKNGGERFPPSVAVNNNRSTSVINPESIRPNDGTIKLNSGYCASKTKGKSAVKMVQLGTTGAGAHAVTCIDTSDNSEGSEDEAVLSVAAARAALGISRVGGSSGPTVPTGSSGGGAVSEPHKTLAATSVVQKRKSKRPSAAEIDAIVESDGRVVDERIQGRCKHEAENGEGIGARKIERRRRRRESSLNSETLGLAVGMPDEALTSMLRRQPRTVPELRTKDSFRDFFKGMEAGRMDRLLRGAYGGSLHPKEVERKVEKRLGLVGDMLAR